MNIDDLKQLLSVAELANVDGASDALDMLTELELEVDALKGHVKGARKSLKQIERIIKKGSH